MEKIKIQSFENSILKINERTKCKLGSFVFVACLKFAGVILIHTHILFDL